MAISETKRNLADRQVLRALLSKQLVPLALLTVFFGLAVWKGRDLDFAAIAIAVRDIEHWQWVLAAAGAAISFWAFGGMDRVMHRLLRTGVSDTMARLSGIASVATAQITGFGLLTGTLARWRVLPSITLWKSAQITGLVSIAFMGSLGLLCIVMVLVADTGLPYLRPIGILLGVAFFALVSISLRRAELPFGLSRNPWRKLSPLFGLTLLDTLAAAFALYIRIPTELLPAPSLFYATFLLALGAGLLGTTPGGVGPFEFMFLLCLPHMPEAPLLAAVIGYRLVYFLLPAALAAVVLIAGPRWARSGNTTMPNSDIIESHS